MKKLISILAVVMIVLAGCSTATEEWSYEGSNGPNNWGNYEDYQTCSDGSSQSPINIETTTALGASDSELVLNLQQEEFEVIDTGHALEFESLNNTSTVVYDGVEYALQQIHFHNSSEHLIDGSSYPVEMHIVNESADSQLLVLSVLFNIGDVNTVIGNNFNEGLLNTDIALDPSEFILDESSYYSYSGSLTTPPCTEGVSWVVFDSINSISTEQYEALGAYHVGNNRPVQDLNDRVVSKN